MRRLLLLTAAVLAPVLAASGLATGGAHAQRPDSEAASSARLAAAVPSRTVRKLLVVVEENHSLDKMRAGMPYTFGLAKQFGYATDYHALRHPSLPNYLAMVSGSMFRVTDDRPPSRHRLHGRTVFGQARHHGKTAGVYADTMPSRCRLTNYGRYAVRHNPWTYFVDERRGCNSRDRRMKAFRDDVAAGKLPRVGMLVPDVCHDAHDCSLATADTWFKAQMERVFAGPDWQSGHLAVVLTADEDDHTQGNVVLTVVIHPSQQHNVVGTRLTHYSLTRLYDEVAGLPYLRRAATAPSMATAFGLPLD
jgi:acid phosphatase